MNTKVLLLLALAAVVAADAPSTGYGVPDHSDESYEVPKYDFEWAVDDSESGNRYGQQEARDDEHTQGSYSVYLPDGRVQHVKYEVNGDSGFLAEVSYEGEARYPDSDESHESYVPPRPTYSAP